MNNPFHLRDAVPSDALFLAKCILAGMHMYDFQECPSDSIKEILSWVSMCETRDDTLYTYSNSRVAEVNGIPVGALLAYPGEEYLARKEKTFRGDRPSLLKNSSADDPETAPGEWYLDSLAVHPDYRGLGIGKSLLLDGIRKGRAMGFKRVTLVADPEYPHLVKLYESLGFVPADTRHAFGTDFLRMVLDLVFL